jgi:hypothetical protein
MLQSTLIAGLVLIDWLNGLIMAIRRQLMYQFEFLHRFLFFNLSLLFSRFFGFFVPMNRLLVTIPMKLWLIPIQMPIAFWLIIVINWFMIIG